MQAEGRPRRRIFGRIAHRFCGASRATIDHRRSSRHLLRLLLEANGFKVIAHVESGMSSVRQRLCAGHTAVINGKFVEGHVPAAQVLQLARRDHLAGIAVPGLPASSPGMEAGAARHAYQVIALTTSGI